MGCVCNGQGNMIAVQSLAFKAQRRPLHPRAMVTLDEASLQALLLYLEQSQQLSRYSNVALHLGNESSETSSVSSPWAFRPSRFERSFTFFQPLLSVLLGTVPWVGSSSGRQGCIVQLLCLVLAGRWLRNWRADRIVGPSERISQSVHSLICIAKILFKGTWLENDTQQSYSLKASSDSSFHTAFPESPCPLSPLYSWFS